jgi:hypothetical protein
MLLTRLFPLEMYYDYQLVKAIFLLLCEVRNQQMNPEAVRSSLSPWSLLLLA